MQGKVCMVTGATAGIGMSTAEALAGMGATMVVLGRNRERCESVVARFKRDTGNQEMSYLLADLSSQDQIRSLASEFLEKYSRLDVLVNNAGGIFLLRRKSEDGIEMTFALNHLNYFLLTNLLLDRIKASAPSRIIMVSSNSHRGKHLDFDNLEGKGLENPMTAYGRTKLCNVLFTYELARRLADTGVTVNALHPGFVSTDIAKNNGWLVRLFQPLVMRSALPMEVGAQTSIYLASSLEVEGVTGKYFARKKAIESDPASNDETAAKRLWQVSAEMTGLA
jgi:NAD(P)-dependent dehydrogenase (short-subunit alcohol dehydrogenase family)